MSSHLPWQIYQILTLRRLFSIVTKVESKINSQMVDWIRFWWLFGLFSAALSTLFNSWYKNKLPNGVRGLDTMKFHEIRAIKMPWESDPSHLSKIMTKTEEHNVFLKPEQVKPYRAQKLLHGIGNSKTWPSPTFLSNFHSFLHHWMIKKKFWFFFFIFC